MRFAALLLHGIVALNRDLAKGSVVRREAVAKHAVVDGVGESSDNEQKRKADDEETLEEEFDAGVQRRIPGGDYTGRRV